MASGMGPIWIGVALIGAALFAPNFASMESASSGLDKPVAAEVRPTPPARFESSGPQRLIRNEDGHFYADAQVNGARVRFMIDTGASIVALTSEDARRAGVQLGDERAVASGVGGEVEVIPITINRIAIGGVAASDVRGAVADQLPVSLLGQSFLTRLASVEIRGDEMVLR